MAEILGYRVNVTLEKPLSERRPASILYRVTGEDADILNMVAQQSGCYLGSVDSNGFVYDPAKFDPEQYDSIAKRILLGLQSAAKNSQAMP
jgi:hypothetical protein